MFGAAAPALAHDQLIDASIDASDTGEATALRLTYSDNVLATGLEIQITDAAGKEVTDGLPAAEQREVIQRMKAPLADGSYVAVWRVVSSDGHPIEGGFTFDVSDAKAGALANYTPVAGNSASEAGEAEHEDGEAHEHEGNEQGNAWVLPVAIGGGVLAIVAVAIPLIVRMRKNAAAQSE